MTFIVKKNSPFIYSQLCEKNNKFKIKLRFISLISEKINFLLEDNYFLQNFI